MSFNRRLFSQSFSGTATAMGTTQDLSHYSRAFIVISGLSAETINVTALVDGVVESAALRPIDLNTGALAAASALGNGSYAIANLCARNLKFTKSAGVSNATVTLSARY